MLILLTVVFLALLSSCGIGNAGSDAGLYNDVGVHSGTDDSDSGNGEHYVGVPGVSPGPASVVPEPVPLVPPMGHPPGMPLTGEASDETVEDVESDEGSASDSPLPIPQEPLDLPINRRTISTGSVLSTVITEDGAMWGWGGFHMPNIWTYVNTVLWRVEQGILFLWDEDGEPFIPHGNRIFGDGRNVYFYCSRTNARVNINRLDILDDAGNPYTMDDLVREVEETAFLMTPRLLGENAASVYSGNNHYMIDEEGVLTIPGGYRHDSRGEVYRVEDLHIENVVDFITGRHTWHYGMVWQQSVDFRYGVLHTDGSFYFLTDSRATRGVFEANIIAMDYGESHMLFLSYNNQLWARGSGSAVGILHHQSVLPPGWIMNDVVQIAVSDRHSMALTRDGRLYSWGRNAQGQLGNGSRHPQNLPVFIKDNVISIATGDEHSMAITADGNLWGWGCNQHGQVGYGSGALHSQPMLIMENIASVSAGLTHTIALSTDGTLWAWGNNANGQLGDGTRDSRDVPVRIMTGVRLP